MSKYIIAVDSLQLGVLRTALNTLERAIEMTREGMVPDYTEKEKATNLGLIKITREQLNQGLYVE